jgi:hypothetical protein
MKIMRTATPITSSSTGPPERRMQLVPLSTDGRVTVVVTASLPPGPLRVALRVDAGNVLIEALSTAGSRPVGRLDVADAAAYRPVLTRLAARGCVGTCPARMVRTNRESALILHLGAPATCAPRDGQRRVPEVAAHPQLATARTTRLRAAVPAARQHRTCPRPTAVPRPRVAAHPTTPTRPAQDDRHVPVRRSPLPARPPARFGQPDDTAPKLTRDQRRRVLWATVAVAAALLLASVLQHGASADAAAACVDSSPTCRSVP